MTVGSAREMERREGLGEGDSLLIRNILSGSLSERCRDMERLEEEINFQEFSHKGRTAARKVALQGQYVDDGLDMPLYRTPGDYRQHVTPWTPTISLIRDELSEYFHQDFNHVKMQLYRNGLDYITKHSDKTLDIQRGSAIVNLNLGTTRLFTIQNKLTGETQDYEFPHNTVVVLGWKTNMNWTHCVNKDPQNQEKRISLVFRQIVTWMTPEGWVYGQGARIKSKEELLNNDHKEECEGGLVEETRLMLEAFGQENRHFSKEGDDEATISGYWESLYGRGFDATDLSALL
jgi:alkylated DNA repair dioxygenase AlkB